MERKNFETKTQQVTDREWLIGEIQRLKSEKKAAVLAHFYQRGEIQDVADFVGDSLAMAQWAARTDAEVLVVCGVYFMAETAKVLCPEKKVLIPNSEAGCSLADGCRPQDFARFIASHPGYKVISYVNTTADIKAMTDVVVTSANARQIVESFPKDEKIIFAPDRNLGAYINKVTGRNMLLWDAACEVHDRFTVENILLLKEKYPQAEVLAHPECKVEVLDAADVIGSTSKLLNHSVRSDVQQFIVATEPGIIHKMRILSPHKLFITVPNVDRTEDCILCKGMQLNTLQNLYDCLTEERTGVEVDKVVAGKAVKSIVKMLELSEKLGL